MSINLNLQSQISKLYQKCRVYKYQFFSSANPVGFPKLIQPALFLGKGMISFGNGVVIGNVESPDYFSGYSLFSTRSSSARIKIGNGVWINNSISLICNASIISIGDNTLLGYNVEILDSDFHPISPLARKKKHLESFPVIIHENVWIGSNVKILKGVTIGTNSVIGNGSIVSTDIPENAVAAGAPAKVIKNL